MQPTQQDRRASNHTSPCPSVLNLGCPEQEEKLGGFGWVELERPSPAWKPSRAQGQVASAGATVGTPGSEGVLVLVPMGLPGGGGHWLVLCGFGLTFELYLSFSQLNSGHQRCLPGQRGSQPAVHSPPMPQAWTEQDSSHLAPTVGRPPPVATLPRPAECARLALVSPCWAPFLQTEPSQLTPDEH